MLKQNLLISTQNMITSDYSGKYSISTGIEGWLLSQTCAGTEPVHAMMHGLIQVIIIYIMLYLNYTLLVLKFSISLL